MKKLFLLLVLSIVCASFTFAADAKLKAKSNSKSVSYNTWTKDLGIGLNVGYPGLGVAVRYHQKDWKVFGAVAFDLFSMNGILVDATGEYTFARIELDNKKRNVIDLSAGLGAGVGIPFGGACYVSFEAGLIGNYNIPDYPLSVFIRLLYNPTLTLGNDVKFNPIGFAGSLGLTYNFEVR